MRRLIALPLVVGVACATTPPEPESPPTPPAPTAPSPDAGTTGATGAPVAPEQAAEPTAGGEQTPVQAPDASTEPSACPDGMVLVEGDYCSEVKHECEKHWWAPQNKKKVCEKFKEGYAECVGGREHKRYCIDKYSWPNEKGARPEVMNKYYQAQVKCAAIGKRLCTESEWTFACEGPDMKPFPYGFTRDPRKCHGDVPWDHPNMKRVGMRDPKELARLWKGKRSGQPECVSDFGVYDLPGNNDEIVSSETFDSGWRGKFDSVHTGGPWYSGVRNQCRPKIYTHNEGFYYYFLGFRCCAEPDGKETDPRTPKQRKKEWRFESVEKLAGFTRDDVREALSKKEKEGHCGCEPCPVGKKCPHSRMMCNTICGTLLGPGAKDHDGSHLKRHPSTEE